MAETEQSAIEGETESSAERDGPSHNEIRTRAYGCWEERGCGHGSPEADWYRAEQELRTARQAPLMTGNEAKSAAAG